MKAIRNPAPVRMPDRRTLLQGSGALLASAALLPFATGANASTYPDKPITIIVPLPVGGPVDGMVRAMAQKMSERMGVPVTVDNKPGAAGLIAAEVGIRAKPDGYTIIMINSGLVLLSATQPKNVRFDVNKDLQPLTYAVRIPMGFISNASAPFRSLDELVRYSKGNPGKVSIGVTPGLGGSAHLTLERMKLRDGMNAVAVPYKGSAPAVQALLANEVTAIIDALSGSAGQLDAGKLKGFAVLTEARSTRHPSIPTIAEAGFPGYEADTWNGFAVAAGTPKEIVDRLHRELLATMELPDIKSRVLALGLEPATNTPEQFAANLRNGIELWTKVVQDAKLKFD